MDRRNELKTLVKQASTPTGGGGKQLKTPDNKLRKAAIAASICSLLTLVPTSVQAEEINSPQSGFILNEIPDADPDNLPPGTITKYIYDETDKTVKLAYYKLELRKTSYGSGPDSKTFTIDSMSTEITVNYDSTNPQAPIENSADISDITISGIFLNNTEVLKDTGGAVRNNTGAIIGNINADFVNNVLEPTGMGAVAALGGAVYNDSRVENIIGNFVDNHAYSTYYAARGGALCNDTDGIMNTIKGNFIANSTVQKENNADSSSYGAQGGAIYNDGEISIIEGDFINNYVKATMNYAAQGGGLYNGVNGEINAINGNFINNYVTHERNAFGGGIYNEGDISSISGDFINNSAISTTHENGYALGGAIYNSAYKQDVIEIKVLNFEEINIYDADDNLLGAVYSYYDENYNKLTETQIKEMLKDGSGYELSDDGGWDYYLYDEETLEEALAYLVADGSIQANPEDLFNDNYMPPVISIDKIRDLPSLTLKNTNLINNHADSENGEAKGGAIYSEGNIKLSADNGKTTFISGNYTKNGDVIDQNAIYMIDYNLIFDSTNSSTIQVDDKIDGENYNFYVIGDNTSKVILNNNVDNAKITLMETNLILGKDEVLNGSESLTLNSGSLSMINGSAGTMYLPAFILNGNTNFASDVNLANKTMDRITADTYTVNTAATLNVNYLNLLNDAEADETRILFADADLANNVAYTGLSPIAYSPVHKYQVDYLKETGEFLFTRGGGDSSNPSDNYNPSVLPTPVNSQAGGYTTQLQTFNYAFQHSDTFMQIPAAQRFAIKNQNKYALSPTGDATDVGVFSPLLTKYETGGIWFKPYASFENIPLKNGPKVNNINYGTLIGFDSNLKSIKHGWERVLTGYIGYNGATQNFSGVTSNQNGGILGTTATFYKGNFFNATTLSVGATTGSNNTMYGSEDYTMLLAGIADKFGYNFEFKEGKYIIQPSMLMSYSFVNTFDYRNAAGVNIQSDPLNALQLAPGIKFIMNTKNGWQPYIGVNMVWNIMDQTKVKANDVRLPSMSIDPYIEYGVGVQRKWGERFMGYAQAMVHNGGRNGISLNGGFRWAIGKR